MGKIIISLVLELMMCLMPLNGCLFVYDEYDLMKVITEEIIQRTGFSVSQAGKKLSDKELVILGLTDENIDKVEAITYQIPDQTCVLVYCVGTMKNSELEERLKHDLKKQKIFILLINDDEISEEQWVIECVNKKLLEVWMYQIHSTIHNKNNAVSIG